MNPLDKRMRAAKRAKDCLLRAAAALTNPLSNEVLAFALLEASVGFARLAEADDESQGGRALFEEFLRKQQEASDDARGRERCGGEGDCGSDP